MRKHPKEVTRIILALLGLVTVQASQANAAVPFIGKYAFLKNKLKIISLTQREQKLASLAQGNDLLILATERSTKSSQNLIAASIYSRKNSIFATDKPLQESLAQSVDNLRSADELSQKIDKYVPTFTDNPKSSGISYADKINQDIQNRSQTLIEEGDRIGLIESQKLLLSDDNEVGREFNGNTEDLEQTVDLLKSQGGADNILSDDNNSTSLPKPVMVSFLLLFTSPVFIMFVALGKTVTQTLNEGFIEDLQEKYGKPQVPEGSVFLHDRSFKEISTITLKAEKINDEKFSNQEFLLYVQFKKDARKRDKEHRKFNNRVELLRAGIMAQKSFLRLESTELRFRSRKQQEFYQFVAENIDDNPKKDEFRDKVKKKLAQIIPLINTEEGRDALSSYLKEVNLISQYDMGLKLLSLFKKYQLADFSVLRTISDISERLQAQKLLSPKNLVSLVIENYDVFEKLAPIIGVSEAESNPETYAKILQYIGLINRHQVSYEQFQQLIKILKQWEKPYKSIMMVRQEYTPNKYRIPKEFTQKIPGLNLHKKYAKHLQ